MAQSVNGSRKRSMFAAQERTRKSIRNRREEGRLVENAKCSATVETADRPRGPADSIMLPWPREARLQSVRDNQAQRLSVLWILMLPGRPDSSL